MSEPIDANRLRELAAGLSSVLQRLDEQERQQQPKGELQDSKEDNGPLFQLCQSLGVNMHGRWLSACAIEAIDRLRAENAELREIGRVWNKEPPKVEGMYLLCDEGVVYCVRIYHDNIWKELWVNLSSFSKPLSDVHRGSWYGPIPSPQEPK